MQNLQQLALTKGESAKVIEAAIRKAADKRTGELTKADYEKVTSLSIINHNLSNVTGLEKLTQLEDLILNNNKLADVKGLEKLTKLRILYLVNNKLTDVRGLENLTQLTNLNLHTNQLTDVKGLENLTQLVYLVLYNNPALTKAQVVELQKALPNCTIVGP